MLFNVMVDAVVREWLRLLWEEMVMEEEELDEMMETLFAIFYVDDAYLALRDPVFLQRAIDGLVSAFKRVGLKTNIAKTQAMICTLGKIRVQLPTDSYKRMREEVATGKESQRAVVCHVCNKALQARSLRLHLSSAHHIHQQVVVADALLEERAGVCYRANQRRMKDPIQCLYPGCPGGLSSPYMLHCHFWDLHPKDTVEILREGNFPWCEHCTMQCNPR
jgi:hypothetical protein